MIRSRRGDSRAMNDLRSLRLLCGEPNEECRKPDWPAGVVHVLTVLAEQLQSSRSIGIHALYVHGSLVLDDFRPGRSDIDFIGIMDRTLTPSSVTELKWLHRRLSLRYPRFRLNGSYVPRPAFKPDASGVETGLSVDGWSIHMQSTPRNEVTRYLLATRAVPLFGPSGSDLAGSPDPGTLLDYVRKNMNDYWVPWVDRVGGERPLDVITATLFARLIEWGVLGISRQLYTLLEHDVISKTGAGEYMLQRSPAQYQPILREALAHRTGVSKNRYRNRWRRRSDALEYMRWVIRESNLEF
jgi:hypothetical protein